MEPDTLHTRAIAQGRAKVQIIQAAEELLGNAGSSWTETAHLKLVVTLYPYRLRQAIAHLQPESSSEILADGPKVDQPP